MTNYEPRRTEYLPQFRCQVYDSILDTIGATPVIRLSRLMAAAGVEAAEQDGSIGPGATLVKPTSGNTGVALAFVCAAKGYNLILTMPDSISIGLRKMLALLGTEIELTPAALGMKGAIEWAEQLIADTPGAIMLQQFENPANPKAHRMTTAEEIWRDTCGVVDVVVSGVGTGGTLTGIADVLKPRKPELRMVAVEPEDSAVLSGGTPGPHKIQGIGAGFVPKILNRSAIDETLRIGNEPAFALARKAAKLEGLPCGISSGAALAAAIEIARRPNMGEKTIIVILPSFAERYLSTPLFEGLS